MPQFFQPINHTTATLALDEDTHAGTTVLLNKADGITVTLPASVGKGGNSGGLNKKEQRKAAAEAREKGNELRKRARTAESQLENLTAQRSAVDQAMFDPSKAEPSLKAMTMTELMKRRAELDTSVAQAEAAWLELSEALEALAA